MMNWGISEKAAGEIADKIIDESKGLYIDAKDKNGQEIRVGDEVKFVRPNSGGHTEIFTVEIKDGIIKPFGESMACGHAYGSTWTFYPRNCEVIKETQ
jgi:hypothetical protein